MMTMLFGCSLTFDLIRHPDQDTHSHLLFILGYNKYEKSLYSSIPCMSLIVLLGRSDSDDKKTRGN